MTKLEALVAKLNSLSGGNLTVDQLQESVAKMQPLQLNEFIEGLFNKVFKSYLFKRVIFSHPILKTFIEEGTSYEAHREYFDVQLISSEDYDLNRKTLSDVRRTKTLNTILSTQLRKVLPLTINLHQARGAFASETAFSQWLDAQFRVITESMNIELYKLLSDKVVKGVVNTVDLTSLTKADDLLQTLNTLSDNMSFPSKAYNLGYQAKITDLINLSLDAKYEELTRTNATKRSDMLLFISPKLKNIFDAKVGSIKYHNQYFNIENYTVITLDESMLKDGDKDVMLLVDKNAFKGYFRINEMVSQFWGANLTTDYFQHYWLVFGEIPWANGVKIKVSNTLS